MIAQAPDVASRAAEEIDEVVDVDTITVHTYDEDPIFSLPVTEKNIRAFNYTIIFKSGNDYDVKINKDKLKIQYIVKIKEEDGETQLLKFLYENVKSDKQYGIYFANKSLEITVYRILKDHFNEKLKLIKTNIYTPVTDRNNFMKKLEEYHGKNHNARQETTAHFKKKFYTLNMEHKYERRPYDTETYGPIIANRPLQHVHIDIFHIEKEKFLTIIDFQNTPKLTICQTETLQLY